MLDRVLAAFSSWVLCVEYVHDLRREPYLAPLKRLKALSKPLVEASRGITVQLRKHHPDAYVGLADEAESMLDLELRKMAPEDLGNIDTFREEENRVLRGAVDALKGQDWARAAEWAKLREGDKSFWLERDPVRRRAWDLVAEAASFGKTLTEHPRPFEGLTHFEDALTRYAEGAALVDRAHRRSSKSGSGAWTPRCRTTGRSRRSSGRCGSSTGPGSTSSRRTSRGSARPRGFCRPRSSNSGRSTSRSSNRWPSGREGRRLPDRRLPVRDGHRAGRGSPGHRRWGRR